MKDLGLDVRVDGIGNIFGTRAGRTNAAPVMTGSHIDTVATGGRYDGNYGVLAGLEVVRWLNQRGQVTDAPRWWWPPSPTKRVCASSPT
jgi:N-carbamoyl-L-amino-acid hydrolase